MRSFSEFDPIAVTLWFFSVIGIAMFSGHPLVMSISLAGAILFFIVRNGLRHGRSHLFFLILFIVLALANPIISHNGATVLFVLNNAPVTLEALLYGINSAAMIVGVLYWFRSFTQIMTSEKVLRIAGAISPKLSLILSMSLRAVPMFARRAKQVSDTQKAMGLYADDNIVDDITGRMRIFSSVSTWALENGIVTADSMAARGYGTGRRTALKRFSFGRTDIIFLVLTIAFTGTVALAAAHGSYIFDFYPSVSGIHPDLAGKAGLAAFFLLVIMPVIKETEAIIRWRYLESKI